MIGFLETTAAFVLVLGILVFVHEFGHFIVAKSFGVGVHVFSLGFGPRLFGFRRRETDYRVSLIPLGGYVRMAGEESDGTLTGAPEEFLSRPRWQRFLVFLAGAAFNIALALAVTWLVLWIYGKDEVKVPETYPVVARILPGSTAEAAGIEVGDRVLSIAGQDARDPRTQFDQIVMSPSTRKEVVVEREGRRLTLLLDTGSDPRLHLGFPGWYLLQDSSEPPVVERILSGTPAERAGLEPGDEVLGVDDREPVNELELRAMLEASAGREVRLKVRSGSEIRTVTLVPRSEDGRGRIGVFFREAGLVHRELTLSQAAVEAVWVNLELSKTLFLTLRKVIGGEISVRAFSGPMEIARASREAVKKPEWFLSFLAFISLQLGILNLLPIPVLDGGHILILGVEGTIGRDLSDRVKERIMQAGLFFLLAFFGVVVYFDFIKAFFSS